MFNIFNLVRLLFLDTYDARMTYSIFFDFTSMFDRLGNINLVSLLKEGILVNPLENKGIKVDHYLTTAKKISLY